MMTKIIILFRKLNGLIIAFFFYAFTRPLQWHYSIKCAETDEEKEKIYQFRYKIYKKDIKVFFLKDISETQNKITDKYDLKEDTINFYASRHGEIIGVLRIIIFDPNQPDNAMLDKYSITEDFIKNEGPCGEMSFFLVKDGYRGGLLGLSLLLSIYKGFRSIGIFPRYLFGYCMPGLLHMYEILGSYVYTKNLIYDPDTVATPFVYTPFANKLFENISNKFHLIHHFHYVFTLLNEKGIKQEQKSKLTMKTGNPLKPINIYCKDLMSEFQRINSHQITPLAEFILKIYT